MEAADEQAVSVAVSIRPSLASVPTGHQGSDGAAVRATLSGAVQVVEPGYADAFQFDRVFGEKAGARPSDAIYAECVAGLVDAALDGYNTTVLAYGQTGTGKTYTMGTGDSFASETRGIVPRAVRDFYEKAGGRLAAGGHAASFSVSFAELYLDDFRDLLGACKKVALRGGGITDVALSGWTRVQCANEADMLDCLQKGARTRAKAGTAMNRESSRSHAVFTVYVSTSRNTAKMHFVDLAGSERVSRSRVCGQQRQEAIHINKSLLALGNVIAALSRREDERTAGPRQNGAFIPYRDSKLTRLLQDSLGGNCRTCMIAFVSPSSQDVVETTSTLNYAARASTAKNRCQRNTERPNDKTDMSSEIDTLRFQLDAALGQLKNSERESMSAIADWKRRAEEAEAELHSVTLPLRLSSKKKKAPRLPSIIPENIVESKSCATRAPWQTSSPPVGDPARWTVPSTSDDPPCEISRILSLSCNKQSSISRCDGTSEHPLYTQRKIVTAHPKERPHTCEICLRQYGTKSNLNRHLRNVHKPASEERPRRATLRSAGVT